MSYSNSTYYHAMFELSWAQSYASDLCCFVTLTELSTVFGFDIFWLATIYATLAADNCFIFLVIVFYIVLGFDNMPLCSVNYINLKRIDAKDLDHVPCLHLASWLLYFVCSDNWRRFLSAVTFTTSKDKVNFEHCWFCIWFIR